MIMTAKMRMMMEELDDINIYIYTNFLEIIKNIEIIIMSYHYR